MKKAGQKRGIWGALLRWVLRGATIAFIAFLALVVIDKFDEIVKISGYKENDKVSAGAHFVRDLALVLLALGGIAMAAWRNREMSRQAEAALYQAEAALEQIKNESNRIAGKGFSDGIKMLARNNEKNEPAIAARIGGIYALQLLANNYVSQYAAQVVRVLVAYVRENAQLTRISCSGSSRHFLSKDVKAAFAVLAQLLDARDESPEEKKFKLSDNDLDFSKCDFSHLYLNYRQVNGLRHYKWQGANLQGSDLQESDLRGSDLQCARFEEARMYGAQLQGADLRGVNLEYAFLRNADLRGASLKIGITDKTSERTNQRSANLRGADLHGADLRGAAFSNADLSSVSLSGAKLQDADFREANLSGVGGGQEEVKSIEMSPNRVWDLGPYRDCPYALAGVLRNFNYYRGLRRAARKLLDDNTLPPGFSKHWREWLDKVSKTGKHPDFRK